MLHLWQLSAQFLDHGSAHWGDAVEAKEEGDVFPFPAIGNPQNPPVRVEGVQLLCCAVLVRVECAPCQEGGEADVGPVDRALRHGYGSSQTAVAGRGLRLWDGWVCL